MRDENHAAPLPHRGLEPRWGEAMGSGAELMGGGAQQWWCIPASGHMNLLP